MAGRRNEGSISQAYGYIAVNSTPSGASVLVGGTYIGTTPIVSQAIMPGTYNLIVYKIGYRDYVTTITVLVNQTTTVNAILLPSPPPDGEVFPTAAVVAGAVIVLIAITALPEKAIISGRKFARKQAAELGRETKKQVGLVWQATQKKK